MERSGDTQSDLQTLLEQIESLQAQQSEEKYSDDPDSGYQKKQGEIESLLNKGTTAAGNNPDSLVKVARLAQNTNFDIALSAAQRAVNARQSPESYLLLADILNSKYTWSQGDDRTNLMQQAEKAARSAVKLARTPTPEMYYRLGDTLEDEGQYVEAETVLRNVLNLPRSNKDSDLYFQAVRDMVLCADGLGNAQDERRWFGELDKSGKASAFDWNTHARQLVAAGEFKNAGDAYSRAAAVIKADWCDAGTAYSAASESDSALYAARQCVDKLTGTKDSEVKLASAHETIAETLNARGVYSEALSQAKEATVLDPSNAFAFSAEADALNNLQRYNEAINASKEALRLSDGKYSSMHFSLGSAYFGAENWELARQSFEKAAELEPKDDAAAYNVAVCYAREGYFNDAAHWYEETLRRNPTRQDKDDLKHRIDALRR